MTSVVLIAVFCVMAAIVGFTVAGLNRLPSVWPALERLADSSSQLSLRAMLVVFLIFLALASRLGLEAILGAFVAGALLRFLDREDHLQNPTLKPKIEALGYGFLVPIFFVTSGAQVDLDALLESPGHLLLVPVFLLAMLVVRGLPSYVFFRGMFDQRHRVAGSVLQATNLTFIVVVAAVGGRDWRPRSRDLGRATGRRRVERAGVPADRGGVAAGQRRARTRLGRTGRQLRSRDFRRVVPERS